MGSRGGFPIGAAEELSGGGPARPRRRRLARRGCALLLIALIAAGALLLARREPLPVPEEFLPAEGALIALELPRGAVPELDRALDALIEQLPPTVALAGGELGLPAGTLALMPRSGPWRAALWREGARGGRAPAEGRFLLFLGGEGFALARERAARAAARRIDGREGLTAAAAAGGILIGDDPELVRSCAARAESASRREIPRDGVRFWRDDPERGAALELWWDPREDLLIERWRGADGAFAWREWLLDHGVEVERIAPEGEPAGQRRWILRGARHALAELSVNLRRW